MNKFHKSAVTCCSFDPSGTYIISGSTDLKVYIISTFDDKIDNTEIKSEFAENTRVSFFIITLNLGI